MKFSIGLVYYSGMKDCKNCLSTIFSQSFTDFEIIFRDQSANKEAYLYIKKKYKDEIDAQKIKIFSGKNSFHSGGHNFCISQMSGENYICASIDMIYKKDMLQIFSNILNKKVHYDCFTGKLINDNKTIDSCGIEKTWYWKFYDIGQNQNKYLHTISKEIFGSSGALFCIRNTSIKKIISEYNYFFDENLHYKNDCELMCRMQLLNQKTWYDAKIYAIHKRKTSQVSQKSQFAIQSSIKGQEIIYNIYKNTSLMKCWQKPFAWGFMSISGLRKFLYKHL